MSNEKSALGVYKYDESLTMAKLKVVRRNKEKRGKKELFVSHKLTKPITATNPNRNVQEMLHFSASC